MTLIATQITEQGVVHAADSEVERGSETLTRQKIFPIRALNAGICSTGSYQVSGETLNTWLPKFIAEFHGSTIQGFAEQLSSRLDADMMEEEKQNLFIGHIAGCPNGKQEMWHVSNRDLNEETGEYDQGSFGQSQDFPRSDRSFDRIPQFQNGLKGGRIIFNSAKDHMAAFFDEVWSSSDFNPPETIRGQEEFMRFYFDAVRLCFENSEDGSIGGATQTLAIPLEASGLHVETVGRTPLS